MGIYDRDYYRREGPSFLGSFVERGTVCKWLVIINILCFILQMLTRTPAELGGGYLPGPFTNALDLNVDKVLHGQVWRLLTHAFLHSTFSVWHILFNMLALWWFGSDVEDLYGPREFLTFYLVSAVVGGLAYTLATVLQFHHGTALGASGAVMAVLVLCAVHYPTRIVYLFFFLPVPIWAFIIILVANDAFNLLGQADTGIGSAAHLGGAAFAFVYYKWNWRILSLFPALRGWRRRLSRPRLRVYREEPPAAPVSVPVAAPPPPATDEQLEAQMDAILEKISRSGKESLTEHEREVLLRASEAMKRRRH
jgi:membrane associated rhomboid family serine protease